MTNVSAKHHLQESVSLKNGTRGTQAGWSQAVPSLNPYLQVVCFSVSSHGGGRASRREGKPDAEDNGLFACDSVAMEVQVSLAPEKAWLGTVGHGWARLGGAGRAGQGGNVTRTWRNAADSRKA